MAKVENRNCVFCTHKYPRDKAQCPSCKQWNIEPAKSGESDGTFALGDANDEDVDLIPTGPWDPCFGRQILDDGSFKFGMAKSSTTLLGGKNGAGKSTLVLQACDSLCNLSPRDVLIVSVEEAAAQVKRLGKRLKLRNMTKRSAKTGCIRICKGADDLGPILMYRKPAAVVIDSLPKLCPDPAAAVEFAKRLKGYCEELAIPGIIINHINKEEEFAGLEALQHEVDACLIFTRYDDNELRELRSTKNRNGLLAKVFFDMTDTGLKEVTWEEIQERMTEEEEEDDE